MYTVTGKKLEPTPISSIRGFFSKFPSLFDEEELPNTEKYLLIFLFCLKSEFPASVTKTLPQRVNVREM